MKEGNLILTRVPQADGAVKNRPAIVLREMPPYRELLVCGVSSQLTQRVPDFDEIISVGDKLFDSAEGHAGR